MLLAHSLGSTTISRTTSSRTAITFEFKIKLETPFFPFPIRKKSLKLNNIGARDHQLWVLHCLILVKCIIIQKMLVPSYSVNFFLLLQKFVSNQFKKVHFCVLRSVGVIAKPFCKPKDDDSVFE